MNAFDMSPRDFQLYLDERGYTGDQRDDLLRRYRRANSPFAGIFDFIEGLRGGDEEAGLRRGEIAPMVFPEGMSGFEAFTTGQARPAVPGFLLGGAEAAASAVDAPSAAAAGLIPAQDAAMEALGTAGFAMGAGGAAVRPAGSVGMGGRVADALPKFREDLGPNDAWLQGKLAKAAKNRAEYGAEGGSLGNLGGKEGVTGWFEEPVMLDPQALKNVRGVNGEEAFRDTGRKLVDLKQSIASEGYKPSPIVIVVREDGVPFISEGNHRLAEAIQSGRPGIPAEIKYLRGAQGADGPLNPSQLPLMRANADKSTGLLAAAAADGTPSLPPLSNAQRTQIAGTLPTYQKAADILGASGPGLDYGAGLGLGARELGFDAFEPFPREGFVPTYTDPAAIPSQAYDRLTNFNVLNVVPREVRDDIVENIGRVIAPGGRGLITTRGRDVLAAKGTPGPEPMSLITSRDTYQKGFLQQELQDYLRYILGSDFEVNPLRLGPAGAEIRRVTSTPRARPAGLLTQ